MAFDGFPGRHYVRGNIIENAARFATQLLTPAKTWRLFPQLP